jgi:hypothetical protein
MRGFVPEGTAAPSAHSILLHSRSDLLILSRIIVIAKRLAVAIKEGYPSEQAASASRQPKG